MLGLPSILPILPLFAQAAESVPPDGLVTAKEGLAAVVAILAYGVVQIALAAVKRRNGNGHCDAKSLQPLLQSIAAKESTASQLAPAIQDLRDTIRDSFNRLSDAVMRLEVATATNGAKLNGVETQLTAHGRDLQQLLLQTDRREARSGDTPNPVGVERRRSRK